MLTLHTASVVLPIAGEPLDDGGVLVEGGRIVAVGPAAELAAAHGGARVRAWTGVLLPGLVNAHAHLQYTDFAELAGAGLDFPAWIRALTARRAQFGDAEWVASARRGVHGLLRSGTTAVADVVTDACVLAPVARAGLAGVSYLEEVGVDDTAWEAGRSERLPAELAAVPAGRTVGVSPHTVYTLDTTVLRGCVGIARERGLRLHPHLAETAEETDFVATGTGPLAEFAGRFGFDMALVRDGGAGVSPAAYLDRVGGLGPDVHVAHGVHCSAGDRALLRERSTAVALCPRSNAILGAGDPPIAAYLDEGSPLALGTDSLASSPSLDLLEEAAAAFALARRQGYDDAGLARRLVAASTLGGATAMGLSDAGRLVAGARADLAVFDVPHGGDPWMALLEHGPGRCTATVLGGRLVHRRGTRMAGSAR